MARVCSAVAVTPWPTDARDALLAEVRRRWDALPRGARYDVADRSGLIDRQIRRVVAGQGTIYDLEHLAEALGMVRP